MLVLVVRKEVMVNLKRKKIFVFDFGRLKKLEVVFIVRRIILGMILKLVNGKFLKSFYKEN